MNEGGLLPRKIMLFLHSLLYTREKKNSRDNEAVQTDTQTRNLTKVFRLWVPFFLLSKSGSLQRNALLLAPRRPLTLLLRK